MELTSSSTITKMSKRRMRRGLHAKKLALIGSEFGGVMGRPTKTLKTL